VAWLGAGRAPTKRWRARTEDDGGRVGFGCSTGIAGLTPTRGTEQVLAAAEAMEAPRFEERAQSFRDRRYSSKSQI